jgi:hypothetical protein
MKHQVNSNIGVFDQYKLKRECRVMQALFSRVLQRKLEPTAGGIDDAVTGAVDHEHVGRLPGHIVDVFGEANGLLRIADGMAVLGKKPAPFGGYEHRSKNVEVVGDRGEGLIVIVMICPDKDSSRLVPPGVAWHLYAFLRITSPF